MQRSTKFLSATIRPNTPVVQTPRWNTMSTRYVQTGVNTNNNQPKSILSTIKEKIFGTESQFDKEHPNMDHSKNKNVS